MSANMHRPKPVDPIWYRRHATIHVHCPCGHHAKMIVGDVARRYRVPDSVLLYELLKRLRCSRCGARDPENAVVR